MTVWEIVTSHGARVSDVATEDEARWMLHTLGFIQRLGMYDYQVFPYSGIPFTATLRHRLPR